MCFLRAVDIFLIDLKNIYEQKSSINIYINKTLGRAQDPHASGVG